MARRVDVLRSARRRIVLAAVTGSLGAGAFGALLGPWLLRLVFGDDVLLGRGLSAVVAAGSTIAVANLVLGILVLAHGRAPWLVAAWGLAVIPGLACLVLPWAGALERTCWAFLVVEVLALGLLLRQDVRAAARLSA